MRRYVAFLRAINVGGHVVKMDRLRAIFEELGFASVTTFINSGNVLFASPAKDAAALETKISNTLRKQLGYEVAVFIRTPDELIDVCEQCRDAPDGGSSFVGFLPAAPDSHEKKLIASMSTAVDDVRAHKREVYWRAGKNFRDAIFQPAKMEKALGKPATFRNANTVRRIAALLAKACLLLSLLAPLSAQPQLQALPPADFASYRGALVRDWVEAVLEHEPGREDEAFNLVRQWSADRLVDAWVSANVMVALLKDPTRRYHFEVRRGGASIPVSIASDDREYLATRAHQLVQKPGRDLFLKRAAVLHADAAWLTNSERPRPPAGVSFLLPRRFFVGTSDGNKTSRYGGDVNWEFGRILLDGVSNGREDADVEAWYRASMKYMLAIEHYDNPHFEHALRLFPRAAEILFAAGCLHESLANPRVQSAMGEIRVPVRTSLDVRSRRDELGTAASLFRRAVEAAPAHQEARLRLGRTLGLLGRHDDARAELKMVRASDAEPLLPYFASLFLGAEEDALGSPDAARAEYDRALGLFPKAQAPRLALSHLAHRAGDQVGAKAILEPVLSRRDKLVEDDPWWLYVASCSRDAEARKQELYQTVRGGS